jgi:hypothetical protein
MKNFLMLFTIITLPGGIINIPQPEFFLKADDLNPNYLTSVPDTTHEKFLSIKPFHLEIISPSSGVQFYRNGIIFLAYSKGSDKMSQKHLSFGTVKPFMALVADTLPGEYMPFLPASSTIFPVEATTFSKDFNTMYLSLIPDNINKEKIFKASYTPDGWVIDDNPLTFCTDNYIYTHPSLSENGDFIVFSSDMVNSVGGLDLFVSRKEGEKWGEPENLGKQINTTGNELFATIDAGNNLYFSSDKLPGLGGYDIFVCLYNGKSWGKPQNLSKAINSENDEVAFTINRTDDKSAFFTSREKFGKGEMQLYRITLNPKTQSGSSNYLSKQIFAVAGITEKAQSLKPETSEVLALNTPEKVEVPTKIPEEKVKDEVNKETRTIPEAVTAPEEKRNVLIYRIQYAANTKPAGSQKVSVDGKNYYSYEYLYKGGYRSTIGEFSTLAEATRFLKLCLQAGYSNSFLVAFKNNERITDAEARILEAQLSGSATTEIKTASGSPKQNNPSEIKPAAPDTEISQKNAEGIIYRVQILANTKPVGSYNITVAGRNYKTFEYLYMGGYRTTIGEFSTLKEATNFQNVCRQSGYNQSFVVAFKNNERINDPALFK